MENEKLISSVKLIRDLRGINDMLVGAGDPFLASVMKRAIKCTENQPGVDAVEVVRCKDCENWNEGIFWCDQHSHYDEHEWDMFGADDFCSFGKRRTDV